jgi:hypothetical protein
LGLSIVVSLFFQLTYKVDFILCRAVTFCNRQKHLDSNVTQKETTKKE